MTSLHLKGLLGTLVPAATLATIGGKLWMLDHGAAEAMIPTAIGYLLGWAAGILVTYGLIEADMLKIGKKGFEDVFTFGLMSLAGAVIGAALAAFS